MATRTKRAKVGHTPGPWKLWDEKVDDANLLVTNDAGTAGIARPIVRIHGPDEQCRAEAIANGRLMAAAPAMLAELRRVEWGGTLENNSARSPAAAPCCPCCRGLSPEYPWPSQFSHQSWVTVGHKPDCTLAAAIAKATGQK